jgi:hypothetical protein
MAWTQTDLDTIETAIAEGTRVVKLDDRLVEYHSITQMLDARDAIKKELLKAEIVSGSVKRRPVAYRAIGGKGL